MNEQHPLVFFWIATYNDNTALPQYDPNTLKPNKITNIDQNKLVKIGWYPFSIDFAEKLNKNNIPAVSNPLLPKYEVTIEKPKRFILYTLNYISQEEYHFCNKCKREFKVATNSKYIEDSGKKLIICPYCNTHDYYQCTGCGKEYQLFSEVLDTPPEKGGSGHCKECGGYLQRMRVIHAASREKRWREYVIGYQETINGRNYKMLMYIHENGDVEIKYE